MAGDRIVVAVSVGTFGGPVGCSDTKGNVYTVDTDRSGPGRLFVCSANAAVALNTSDRITATYPGFSGSSIASASEFSGVDAVVGHQSANGNSASPSSGATGLIGELSGALFGAIAYSSTPIFTPGCAATPSLIPIGAVTVGTGSGTRVLVPMYRTTTGTGSYTACGTLSSSRPWIMTASTFR